jgi:hypothetical protein
LVVELVQATEDATCPLYTRVAWSSAADWLIDVPPDIPILVFWELTMGACRGTKLADHPKLLAEWANWSRDPARGATLSGLLCPQGSFMNVTEVMVNGPDVSGKRW